MKLHSFDFYHMKYAHMKLGLMESNDQTMNSESTNFFNEYLLGFLFQLAN